ncbi:MAG TPA: hypothetical protein VIJ51_05785 [Solirubrobacteraceae bacterium]
MRSREQPSGSTTRRGGAVEPVDQRRLAGIGFTDHAIERFAQRAGLETTSRARVEPVIRDLLLQEGVVTTGQPRWARSQNTAELYLQLGEWMLFVLRPDRQRPGGFTAVTVVNGPAGNDWATALRRGYVLTPPPPCYEALPPRQVGLARCIGFVLAERRTGDRSGRLLAQVVSTYRQRRTAQERERERVAAANRATQDEYEAARSRARQSRER